MKVSGAYAGISKQALRLVPGDLSETLSTNIRGDNANKWSGLGTMWHNSNFIGLTTASKIGRPTISCSQWTIRVVVKLRCIFCTPRIILLVSLCNQITSIPKERDCAASLGCCCLASAVSDQVYASANAYLSDLIGQLAGELTLQNQHPPPQVPSISKKEDQCLWCYSVD